VSLTINCWSICPIKLKEKLIKSKDLSMFFKKDKNFDSKKYKSHKNKFYRKPEIGNEKELKSN